jgi:hypothetical protein
MGITYSMAEIPELVPTSRESINLSIPFAEKLRLRSGDRIVINGKENKQPAFVEELCINLHKIGYKIIMYTGTWGCVDLEQNKSMLGWAQRDKNGNPLGYNNSMRGGMLCPISPYIDTVLIPWIVKIIYRSPINTIFFDIPWIMKGGCYCEYCKKQRDEGLSNNEIVRYALQKLTRSLKTKLADIKLAINAGAPGINTDNWTGGHISNLTGLFDEYVTEWNPFYWGQSASVISESISHARSICGAKISHATTITNRTGTILTKEQLRYLFHAIVSEKAEPWITLFSIYLKPNTFDLIQESYVQAKHSLISS